MQPVTVRLRVFGVDAHISVEPGHADAIRAQWAWSHPDAPTQRAVEPLPGCGRPDASPLMLRREPDADATRRNDGDYALTTSLTREAIMRCAGHYLMLHAGGICEQSSGRVAGLVAASGTGKTTAVRHFGAHGYGYVTDETLVVGAAGRVLPYPKPLSIIVEAHDSSTKSQHDPGRIGLAVPRPGPLTLGPLVLLRRLDAVSADADTGPPERTAPVPRLKEMYLLDGLAEILPQSSAAPQIPGCLALLADLAQTGGGVHELTYTQIDETDHLLRAAFAAEPRRHTYRHVPGPWGSREDVTSLYAQPVGWTAGEAHLDDGGRVAASRYLEAIIDDAGLEALVLLGATPVRLSGLATVVWEACLHPHDLGELTTACVAALGDHPDATGLVRETVTRLLREGVLRPAP